MFDEKSCGILIYRLNKSKDPEFLILNYEEGHWDFPKGHVELNETELETALRELKEETGIENVQIISEFREYLEYSYMRNGKKSTKQVVFFLGKVYMSQKITLSSEHNDFKWLSFSDALSLLTYENAKEILKKGNKKIIDLLK